VRATGMPLAELREWSSHSGFKLPTYSDETGAVTRAYGNTLLPRAVVIDGRQRILRIRAGYDGVIQTDWERELP
jgi:hypothetical protein